MRAENVVGGTAVFPLGPFQELAIAEAPSLEFHTFHGATDRKTRSEYPEADRLAALRMAT